MRAYTPNSIEKDDFIYFPAGPKAPHVDVTSAIVLSVTKARKSCMLMCCLCGINPVEAENGFDTCNDCVSLQP